MRTATEERHSDLTDYLGAAVIIMATTFGPGVAWLLGLSFRHCRLHTPAATPRQERNRAAREV